MSRDTEHLDKVTDEGSGEIVRTKRRKWPWVLAGLAALVVAFNLSVWIPAANAIGADERNEGVGLHVYRSGLVHPTDITVDLVTVGDVAPIDLMRALFQSAEALEGRSFGRVTLARQGKPVFVMEGEAFQNLGREYGDGQNPIYLVRTLPELLYRTDGRAAFGTWSGGWLGVMTKQMEDVTDFGTAWVSGEGPAQ